MIYTFSDQQPLNATGDTTSTRALDLQAVGAPLLANTGLYIRAGADGIEMVGGGMFQVLLETSLDGVAWGVHKRLTPALGVGVIGGGQVLTTAITPALGKSRFVRLAYRVISGTVRGSISAIADALPVNRFGYERSGFEVD
jgi:hypothetical protein